MLPDIAEVVAVCEGRQGALVDALPGAIVVIMGTVSPVAVRAWAARSRRLASTSSTHRSAVATLGPATGACQSWPADRQRASIVFAVTCWPWAPSCATSETSGPASWRKHVTRSS